MCQSVVILGQTSHIRTGNTQRKICDVRPRMSHDSYSRYDSGSVRLGAPAAADYRQILCKPGLNPAGILRAAAALCTN